MEIIERHMASLDPDNLLLRAQGASYGRRIQHRGCLISVSGCETPEAANEWVAVRAIRDHGWKFREQWWQFWLPVDPREPVQDRQEQKP